MEGYLERSLKNITISTYQGLPCISIKYQTMDNRFVQLSIRMKPEEKFEAVATLFACEELQADGSSEFFKRLFSAVRATDGQTLCPLLPPQP